ncbi:hypothetical protein FOL47_006265 [Perkinsus chesapeaki]|uniref:poly(ADP-ribose) glycohydrolase n=1 Tax=Perkinsus chesapeaki TaxID=330153 RepID=A0A7J6LSY7_PERCH|nr:hypothetical protein FOL47_006265 [Perkinsus chesapeaki]
MSNRDPLAVKVMRVSQVQHALPVHTIVQECHNPLLPDDVPRQLENISLKLPREVSDMFVGEAFQGYIHVAVDSPNITTLYNLSIKVELSCPSVSDNSITLLDTTEHPLPIFAKECPIEQVVSTRGRFPLAEPSMHILQVQITYALSPGGPLLYFKRSYKFPVVAPIAVHHEVVQLDTRILCNVTVTNTHSAASIAIFKAKLDPIPGFICEAVGDTRRTHVLMPQEASAAEYIFTLRPKGSSVDVGYVRELVSCGAFEYQWRCPQLGSASDAVLGVRQELSLQPIPVQELDLRLATFSSVKASRYPEGLPEGTLAVTMEEPFSIDVEIVNNSEKDINTDICFDFGALGEVQIAGPTERCVGAIPAFTSHPLTLSMFPFSAGIFTLGEGISLRNSDSDSMRIRIISSTLSAMGFPILPAAREISDDGCMWVDGLGCDLSYEAECAGYHRIETDGIFSFALPQLHPLDREYYTSRCDKCLPNKSREECLRASGCEWSGCSCTYPKSVAAGHAMEMKELGEAITVDSSFIALEVTVNKLCRSIKEEEDCCNVRECIWYSRKDHCIRNIWAVMKACCPALEPIYSRGLACRNRSFSIDTCLARSSAVYIYLPTASTDWLQYSEIMTELSSLENTTPDRLRSAMQRVAEIYVRRDRATRFYKDLPKMMWKLPVEERDTFLVKAIPEMARRVIEIEAILGSKTVLLLRRRRGGPTHKTVSFTPYQASALLALAFFGVPMYWSDGYSARGKASVRFNFANFFRDQRKQVTSDTDRIEDAAGRLQADFANCRVGGGVLSGGCVQEEIRFIICPELLLSILVGSVDPLADYEAMYIHGAIQYTDYSGYGSSFECTGSTETELGQQESWVIVMDALHFGADPRDQKAQYTPRCILRELNKCYIAVTADGLPDGIAFATGNWGCGVFGGDPQLKSMIQWLACSLANRKVEYFPYGDTRVSNLAHVVTVVEQNGWTVADLAAKIFLWLVTRHDSLFELILNEDLSSRAEATMTSTSSLEPASRSPSQKKARSLNCEVDKSLCVIRPLDDTVS